MPVSENILESELPAINVLPKTAREIFFIDDDEDDLMIFEIGMKDLNIPVSLRYGKSGDELFKLLDQTQPDLIFLDLHMPGKSGITCLKMIRFNKNYDSIPIIIYSKLSQKSFVDDCYLARANYYIVKPVSISKLTKAIRKVIETNWDAERYPSRENFVIE